jgi:hypothetical protein
MWLYAGCHHRFKSRSTRCLVKDKGFSQLVQDLRQMRDKAESLSREQHELALQLKATLAAAQKLMEKMAKNGGD